MNPFKKASKKQARLRLALIGPSGSGKTYSALAIAAGLGVKVAVIDTERGSASKYADKFPFDVLELHSFSPANYCEAIHAAEAAGYDVVVVDSLSHAWFGKDGALEMVDNAQKRQKSANSYTAWRDVTPEQNKLIDAMLQSSCHIVSTLRSKTEYVLEEDSRGKKVPRRVGMAPVQRDGMEYEFDCVGEMDLDHNVVFTKSRCSVLTDKVFKFPGADVAKILNDWLEDGTPAVQTLAAQPGLTTADKIDQPPPADPPKTPTVARVRSGIAAVTSFDRAMDGAKLAMRLIDEKAPGWDAPGDILHFAAMRLCDLAESQDDLFASADLLDPRLDKDSITRLGERRTNRADALAVPA